MTVQQIKQQFGIIGDSLLLNRAIETAIQVAPTDISALVSGESGTGKEVMPQIIHKLSPRKHNKYIAVNCGAIPEGTIDSELFGHEKGAFTGAQESRQGYFEVADKGTIFLDEVSELPLETQVRLLRVLETGEYLRVGSSRSKKTDVRIVAASNVDLQERMRQEKFREDLYYRLNTVPIHLPPLRERQEDIPLLFRKFALDMAEKYHMPKLKLTDEAAQVMKEYRWPGNIRQLKNITEQLSVIQNDREVTPEVLMQYLPHDKVQEFPAVADLGQQDSNMSEREILYKVLFDMKNDINDLKRLVLGIIQNPGEESHHQPDGNQAVIRRFYEEVGDQESRLGLPASSGHSEQNYSEQPSRTVQEHEEVEESLSLSDQEKELIRKALERNKGKRKSAARELGISERTLYRKIKEYNIS